MGLWRKNARGEGRSMFVLCGFALGDFLSQYDYRINWGVLVLQIRPQLLPSRSFPIHCSPLSPDNVHVNDDGSNGALCEFHAAVMETWSFFFLLRGRGAISRSLGRHLGLRRPYDAVRYSECIASCMKCRVDFHTKCELTGLSSGSNEANVIHCSPWHRNTR
jgi:hypothetical protein